MRHKTHLTPRQKELRLKYRGDLDAFPPAEVVIPADIVKRKSSFYAAEMDGFISIETAWQLIRDAIDDALKLDREDRLAAVTLGRAMQTIFDADNLDTPQ